MPATATFGNLANAQKIAIKESLYVQEHNAPAWGAITHMSLAKGHKTITLPKLGAFSISRLTDGVDMTTEQELNMTTVDFTASEFGAKIIVTDQLVDQNATDPIFQMIGKNFGTAAARVQEKEVETLYAGLNGGTVFGSAGSSFGVDKLAGLIARCVGKTTQPFHPEFTIQHPNTVYDLTISATPIGSANQWPEAWSKDKMGKFYKFSFNGCTVFESGNLSIDASDDCVGVIAQKDAMVAVEAKTWYTEKERDASRRATEVNFVSRWGVFEMDDQRGAGTRYDAGQPVDAG